ncbi:MAG: hypothetical protein K6C40_13555 [Thermoguttaceae bacterium]|nr:hypothetical protein [Thermoguttaceae bacterium]
MAIEQENADQTQVMNQESEEEMNLSDITGHFLGELVPGHGRIMTCLVILVFFLIITLVFWRLFGERFYEQGPTRHGQGMNQLTLDKIRLVHRLEDGTLSSEIPPWIHEKNIAETIYNRLSPNTLSIYNEKQIECVQNAIKEVYWIQNIERIRKFYPTFLEIEVTYRRPAMLVSVLDDSSPDYEADESKGHLYYIPLSSDCCILPKDPDSFPVPVEEREDFPTFCGEAPEAFYDSEEPLDVTAFSGWQPPRSETPGTSWNYDSQIKDALKIVNLLGDRWKKFGLDYICLENNTNDRENWYSEKQFCLVTKNGSRIHWGRCVDKEVNKDDVLDTDKIEKLDDLFNQSGYLDTPEKQSNISFRQQTNHEKTLH